VVQRSVVGLLRGWRERRRSGDAALVLPAVSGRRGRDTKLGYLSAIDIFRDLQPDDLRWLAAHTTMITAPAGQLIYMPGETSEGLFLLKAGKVRIYRLTADGKKLTLSILEASTFFGDMPLAGQQMYGAFAEAIDSCTLCVLGRADLERLIESRPRVAIRLLEVIGRRLVEAESVIEAVAFKSVPARLATVLVRLAAEGDGTELNGYTHQDLAEMIGTYRETATLTLDDFRRRGLVDLRRKQIRILDRRSLAAIAEGR